MSYCNIASKNGRVCVVAAQTNYVPDSAARDAVHPVAAQKAGLEPLSRSFAVATTETLETRRCGETP